MIGGPGREHRPRVLPPDRLRNRACIGLSESGFSLACKPCLPRVPRHGTAEVLQCGAQSGVGVVESLSRLDDVDGGRVGGGGRWGLGHDIPSAPAAANFRPARRQFPVGANMFSVGGFRTVEMGRLGKAVHVRIA